MDWAWLSFMAFAAGLVEFGWACRETSRTCAHAGVCTDLRVFGEMLPILHDAAEECLGWRYRVDTDGPAGDVHGRVGRMWRRSLGWRPRRHMSVILATRRPEVPEACD